MTPPKDLKYWVGFSLIPGVGRARIALLEQGFPDLAAAWQAPAATLLATGLDRRTVRSIVTRRDTVDPDAEMAKLHRLGVHTLTPVDPRYPALLRETDDHPAVLYVLGEMLPEDRASLAVVGTRRASAYGREATSRLVADMVRSNVTIVSGLARGIDTMAHRTALDHGGRTIAVLASGLDTIYPADNTGLAREIVKRGALVSEHPLGVKPEASFFPRRNRIMSGLSLGVLLVEAGEQSGASITVRYALDQNRDVFAVPGSIFSPGSRGAHRWIQEGAKLVTRAEDVLEELNLAVLGQQMELKAVVPATPVEQRILRLLSHEPAHIDAMARQTGLPVAEVSSALAMMELKGMVRQVGGMNFVTA
ncbi:MAG: DNA-protecting protein DprA [Dehalococcoidia bacterium]|nr:DNA-protecting protein DprA [Dehalococcoidia bacterium]